MVRGLTLKYEMVEEDWHDFMSVNPYSESCQLVGKNGKITLNTFILASISPFLAKLLLTLLPYIDGCLILPDV